MFDDREVANLGILRTAPIMTEFSKMERHHFTSQIFIPLNGKRSLVAVAPPSDVAPALDEVKIFLMEGNQGVNLFRKTWHHTLFPLDGETDYVLIQRGGDVGDDVEFAAFEQGARVTVD
jgi:ureidoglycolate lyase